MSRKITLRILLITLLVMPFFLFYMTQEQTTLEGQVRFAMDPYFLLQSNGLEGLEKTYGFKINHFYEMAIGLTHEALRFEDVEIGLGFTTDGKIKELNLVKLKDDRGFFPPNNPALVIRREVLEEYPSLKKTMNQIIPLLDGETMIRLNYLVDIEEIEPLTVAKNWLKEKGLLLDRVELNEEKGDFLLSSPSSTQNEILNCITLIALKDKNIPVSQTTYLFANPETSRRELLEGEIHISWEYLSLTCEALLSEEEYQKDPEILFQTIAQKDLRNDLIWIDYAPFSCTYTFIMRREQAEKLGITTFSQLAQWINTVESRK